METQKQSIVAHPQGEQPTVEVCSAIADTFAGRIHVDWDAAEPRFERIMGSNRRLDRREIR